MAFNVQGLINYIEEQKFPLMARTINSAKMMQLVEVMPNVKGPTKLPLLAQSVFFQADDCSFVATGDSTFTQRTLTPGKVKLNSEWCPKDLESKFYVAQMRAGAHSETVQPEDVWRKITETYLAEVAIEIEKNIWQGSVSAPTSNNGAFWDGFITTIGSGYIDANAAGIYSNTPLTTAFTATNAQEMAFRLYTALANNGLTKYNDNVAFIGYDAYAALQSALILGGASNGVQINSGAGNPDTDAMEGIMFPGVNLKFIPVHGLTATNKAYAGRASNMFIGVDAESDFDSLEIWYSKDDRKVKVAMEFKVGTQVAFPNEIAAIVL